MLCEGTNKLITNYVDMMDVDVAYVGGDCWMWLVWAESKRGGVKKGRSQKIQFIFAFCNSCEYNEPKISSPFKSHNL